MNLKEFNLITDSCNTRKVPERKYQLLDNITMMDDPIHWIFHEDESYILKIEANVSSAWDQFSMAGYSIMYEIVSLRHCNKQLS